MARVSKERSIPNMAPMKQSKYPVLIILSGGLTGKGNLPFFVKNKLDQAYRVYKQGFARKIIVSGKGSLYIEKKQSKTDAEVMAHYLISLKVPPTDILKEEQSLDTLSSLYYIKKRLLEPKKYTFVRIIAVDFEEERIKYCAQKILGKTYHIHFDITHSQIKAEILWNLFSYERQALSNTKAFLRKMKTGDHTFLENRFYTGKFYNEHRIGYIREMVHNGTLGKRRSARAHFSLNRINDAKDRVYEDYGITDAPRKILMADFWSGRFLNFFGHDAENTLYSLKFVLYVKDKKTFSDEIAITKYLQNKGIEFIPKIIAENTKKAPPWYLYRIVEGKNAGEFSYTYSFNEGFYKKKPEIKLAAHLLKLRSLKGVDNVAVWDSKKYKKEMTANYNRIGKFISYEKNAHLEQAYQLFIAKLPVLDCAKKYLTHADLHPANILISRKELYIIDFEHICQNNIAFDFCFAYLFGWNNEEFKKRFYDAFVNTLTEKESQEFEELFPIVHLYFLFFLLRFTYIWEYKSGKDQAKTTRAYITAEVKKILKMYASS